MLKFWKQKGKEEHPESIWDMEDDSRFIPALFVKVAQKCGDGERMEALSPTERVFYVTQQLEEEVNNGGFYSISPTPREHMRRNSGTTSVPKPSPTRERWPVGLDEGPIQYKLKIKSPQ